ncbi:hypothetical protein PPACK8108_LOCUS23210 [Phakopsora pachyrhizi]|uniref:HTH CENPB-type domain-containing protein n=1 Tax=Phakopsora pachyrhizi TaxID=170000 RepID=A0AAV0BPI4_PHAPC|nr:hypothetical protein PPACK8108_LOCUS23210 [Phakopsora pachyrhizi]
MSWDWFSQFRKLHRPILELQPRDVTNFIEGTRKVLNQDMDIREQAEVWLSRTEGDEAAEERRVVVIIPRRMTEAIEPFAHEPALYSYQLNQCNQGKPPKLSGYPHVFDSSKPLHIPTSRRIRCTKMLLLVIPPELSWGLFFPNPIELADRVDWVALGLKTPVTIDEPRLLVLVVLMVVRLGPGLRGS